MLSKSSLNISVVLFSVFSKNVYLKYMYLAIQAKSILPNTYVNDI